MSGELIYDPRALPGAGDLVDLVECGYDIAVRLRAGMELFAALSLGATALRRG